jgi:hypothetical protein
VGAQLFKRVQPYRIFGRCRTHVGYFGFVLGPDKRAFVNWKVYLSFRLTGALVRKAADVNLSKFRWNLALPDWLGADSEYPTKSV